MPFVLGGTCKTKKPAEHLLWHLATGADYM